jgi:glycosyltransferase involved in cell wall biosynthesis
MVSVIIPTYNYASFIGQTLRSLQLQSYPDFECLIIDNGSTDNTAEVVKPFLRDQRFKYIKQENKGVSAARIAGLKAAGGEYILFLDADDLIERDKLKVAVEILEKHEDVALVYSDMRYFKSEEPGKLYYRFECNSRNDTPWMSYVSGSRARVAEVFLNGNTMVISSPVFRHQVISEIGLPDQLLDHNEDWDFWLRMVLAGKKIMYVERDETMTLIRVHKGSASRNIFGMQVAGLRVLQKNSPKIKELKLGKLLAKRIQDHEKAITAGLLRTPNNEFDQKIAYLKKHGLLEHFFKKQINNPFLAKIYLGLKTLLR